jgi:hypothetical protein
MSGLVYPQLGTGALSQFPIRKMRRARTVVNTAPDGSTVQLNDPAAETTEWQLEYGQLSDSEAAALEQFFLAAEGTLHGFTFLDPSANLLAWSEQLDHAVWQKDPLLQVAPAAEGWALTNAGGAEQGIGQTIVAPGEYTYCFSVYARSATPASVRLWVGSESAERVIAGEWGRVSIVSTGEAGTESLRFAVAVPAGMAVEIQGPQAEAQGGASVYRATTRGGVHEDAHLAEDVLRMTRTGWNRNACTVKIIHANHL